MLAGQFNCPLENGLRLHFRLNGQTASQHTRQAVEFCQEVALACVLGDRDSFSGGVQGLVQPSGCQGCIRQERHQVVHEGNGLRGLQAGDRFAQPRQPFSSIALYGSAPSEKGAVLQLLNAEPLFAGDLPALLGVVRRMKRLVLLQTPAHAASEIGRLMKSVRDNDMPVDDTLPYREIDADTKRTLLREGSAASFDRERDVQALWAHGPDRIHPECIHRTFFYCSQGEERPSRGEGRESIWRSVPWR